MNVARSWNPLPGLSYLVEHVSRLAGLPKGLLRGVLLVQLNSGRPVLRYGKVLPHPLPVADHLEDGWPPVVARFGPVEGVCEGRSKKCAP